MATFESMKLRPELVRACLKQGFREPTAIQALVMPVVAAGRDVVVEAMTGSGKTLAYGLPLLDREPLQDLFPESLVVAPTRELAQQIQMELERSAGTLRRSVIALVGGGGMDRQKARLDAGASIVVGTLGRIEELLERKLLRLDHVRTVVLDEVDELLRGGFSENLAGLLGQLPAERQTLLFSATIPTEVEAVARRFTTRAARLRLTAAREQPAELAHRVLFTTVEQRIANLVGYLRAERPYQTLVFCGTRRETEELRAALAEHGIEAQFLHGELSPTKRRQLLEHFRSGDLPVLVVSDLVARGLDLPGVDLIVNYSLPAGMAAYLHRAGRTGRAGRAGTVMSLVIGQQHEQYEKLKRTFAFESVEISPRGKLFSHPAKTREQRDMEFRKLPPSSTSAANGTRSKRLPLRTPKETAAKHRPSNQGIGRPPAGKGTNRNESAGVSRKATTKKTTASAPPRDETGRSIRRRPAKTGPKRSGNPQATRAPAKGGSGGPPKRRR